jgi:hypothetical protein
MHHVIDENGEHIELLPRVSRKPMLQIQHRRSIILNPTSKTLRQIPDYAQSVINSDKPPAIPPYERKGDLSSNVVGITSSHVSNVPLVSGINSSSF